MKIAHIFSSYPNNYQPYIQYFLDKLKERGNIIKIFSVSPGDIRYKDVVYLLDDLTSINKLYSLIFNFIKLYKYKKYTGVKWKIAIYNFSRYKSFLDHKEYIFHIHHISIVHRMLLKFLICFDIKYCLSIRGSDVTIRLINDEKQKQRAIEALNHAQGIHTISKYLRNIVIDLGIQSDKITDIPRLVSEINFDNKKYNNKKFHFLTVGRFHWVKGYSYILEACNQLNNRGIEFYYTICGSNDINLQQYWVNEQQHLDYLISLYKLNNNVQLLGFVDQKGLNEEYRKSDIFICGSINEGLNTSIIKALQYNKIVVAPNVGGIPEYISNKINGLLFNPGDSSDLLNCLLMIINKEWKPSSFLPSSYPNNETILDKFNSFYSNLNI